MLNTRQPGSLQSHFPSLPSVSHESTLAVSLMKGKHTISSLILILLFFDLQENSAPSKAPWDSFKTPGDYQHYTTINVLDTEAKDALELRPAEWEKCLNLPLDVQEGDFQTEV